MQSAKWGANYLIKLFNVKRAVCCLFLIFKVVYLRVNLYFCKLFNHLHICIL